MSGGVTGNLSSCHSRGHFFFLPLCSTPIQRGFYFFSIKLGKKRNMAPAIQRFIPPCWVSFYFVKLDTTRGHRRFWLWGSELWNKEISELISSLIGQHVGFLLLLLLCSSIHQLISVKTHFNRFPLNWWSSTKVDFTQQSTFCVSFQYLKMH